MANPRYSRKNTCVYNIGYHLIWCPKYRRNILIGILENRLKELLSIKAKELSIEIITLEIMPNHLHLFVKCDPTDSPAFIVSQLKGFTSHALRDEFSYLKRKMPSMWTRSYYCESVGHISEDTVKKYIEDQKNK